MNEQADREEADWASYLWASDAGDGQMMLRNLYGLRSDEELVRREYAETALRAWEIESGEVEIPSTGDLAEWQAIHRHLFGAIYSWAGELRTVGTTKSDERPFLHPDHFEESIARVFDRVDDLDWARMPRAVFVDNAARYYMLLNWVHPFREGNGRTTRMFLDRQISAAPYTLDYSRVDADRWDAASAATRPLDYEWPSDHTPLATVFDEITIHLATPPGGLDPTNPVDLAQIIDNAHRTAMPGPDIADTIDAALPDRPHSRDSAPEPTTPPAAEAPETGQGPDLDVGPR